MRKGIFRTLILGILMGTLLLTRCGEEGDSASAVQSDDEIDYFDAASFENALNDGTDVLGSVVVFDVVSYKPDSAMGIDCWSGEHLNFISEEELDVVPGDIITGKVTEKPSKVLGSWKIPYVVMSIEKNDGAPVVDRSIAVEETTPGETIETPISNLDCEGKDYREIEQLFKDAGFINVSVCGYELEETDSNRVDGEVISVWAGESDSFEQGENIDKNTEIGIGYAVIIKADNSTEATNTESSAAVQETKPAYSITDLSTTMYATTNVNVRSIPDTSGDKVGSLEANQEVTVTGKVDNGWYRINNNGEGYVLGDYLTSEKATASAPVVAAPVVAAPAAGNTGNGNGNSEPSVIVPSQADTEGNLVWVPTNGGKKYHSYAGCSGMENPIQVTLEHAEANGYTPCKRCH